MAAGAAPILTSVAPAAAITTTRQEAGIMSAEATTQDEPRLGELITLMGWPWKLALALLGSAAVLQLLPGSGLPDAAAAAAAGGGEAAMACAVTAALLALGGGLHTLRQLLRSAAEEPTADVGEGLVQGLRQLLEEQQRQVHEATAAVSRAVTTGAQLSGLANSVEKRFRQVLEQGLPAPSEAASVALSSRLELCTQRMAAAQDPLQALPAAAAELAAGIQRLEMAATAVAQFPEKLQALSGTAGRMTEQSRAAQLQAARLSQRMEGLLDEAVQRLAEAPPARLEELVHSLGGHIERVLRNEATLGDAARYLTETTDRFAAGTAALETHAVRLQAMISITGQQAAARSGGVTSPKISHALERLGAVEADAAQLLQEARAMSQQALPSALAHRTAALLQAVQENARHLHAAASALTQTDDGPAQAAA